MSTVELIEDQETDDQLFEDYISSAIEWFAAKDDDDELSEDIDLSEEDAIILYAS